MNFIKPSARQEQEEQTQVCKQSLALCWEHSRTNPTVGSCLSYISSRLLGPGFIFSST
jgi:hypothetical protein